MKLRSGHKANARRDERRAGYDGLRDPKIKAGRTRPGSQNPHKGCGAGGSGSTGRKR